MTLTAPGGSGGNTGSFGFIPPTIITPSAQTLAVGVDYQASDLGGSGFALTITNQALQGGVGGSGDYGIGGLGAFGLPGNGANADGNGGGGGGGALNAGQLVAVNGGNGSPGWIVEEFS